MAMGGCDGIGFHSAGDKSGVASGPCAAVPKTSSRGHGSRKLEASRDMTGATCRAAGPWTCRAGWSRYVFARSSVLLRSRNALLTTDTELKLMASAAIIGDRTMPSHGYRMPAANGTPIPL